MLDAEILAGLQHEDKHYTLRLFESRLRLRLENARRDLCIILILTENEVNIGNKRRVKVRGEAVVFYEVFISYTDQVRSQYYISTFTPHNNGSRLVFFGGVSCARNLLIIRIKF